MKKRSLAILICAILLMQCMSGVAELNLSLETKKLSDLYKLYLQCDAQEQLLSLQDRQAYHSVTDYDSFERQPASHKGERITFTGTVVQVVEGSYQTVYRIAQNNDNDKIFYVIYRKSENTPRLLKDDKVTVYAVFTELRTYTSTTNLQVTVPQCEADLVIYQVSNKSIRDSSAADLNKAKKDILEHIHAKLKIKNGITTVDENNYGDYSRNPQNHVSEQITFSGKVLQVLEGSTTILRVAVGGNSSNVIYTKYTKPTSEARVLEDDKVTVTGTFDGLYTYTSTLGGEITIPSCVTENVKITGSKRPKIEKDKDGYSYINAESYEDFNRYAEAYEGQLVRLTGKVVQVMEGTGTASYRVGLEKQQSSVVYVNISLKDRDVRVLENDTVTVYGVYSGLYSYTSTLGATITIPCVQATKITVKGYTSGAASGSSTVKKSNYSDYARNEQKYMGQTIKFTAKVVQVVEGDSTNIYRMAVDKDSDCIFLVTLSKENMIIRILEDDIITVVATYSGLYTYNSTRGGKITVPSCELNSYSIQGYSQQTVKPSNNGVYKITKSNYQEFARNPNAYDGKTVSFTGKVLQVVERSYGPNIYRIAVGSDSNCVMYVQFTLPANSPRILEKDSVTVTGIFTGLYTYTTTLGSSVTIPSMTAEKITRK